MDRPRLIHYNDAHHFHAKRLEPPASRHLLNWPVDEVLGTGVDLLVLGLGYSDVFFHQSAVGRVVGRERRCGKTTSTGGSCGWSRWLRSWTPTRYGPSLSAVGRLGCRCFPA